MGILDKLLDSKLASKGGSIFRKAEDASKELLNLDRKTEARSKVGDRAREFAYKTPADRISKGPITPLTNILKRKVKEQLRPVPVIGQTKVSPKTSEPQRHYDYQADEILSYMNSRSRGLMTKRKESPPVLGDVQAIGRFFKESAAQPGRKYGDEGSDIGNVKFGDLKDYKFIINEREISNFELGNFFVGVNAYRSGVPLGVLNQLAMAYTGTQQLANARARNVGQETYTGNIADELDDRKLYKAGYLLAKELGNEDITKEHIRDLLLPIMEERTFKGPNIIPGVDIELQDAMREAGVSEQELLQHLTTVGAIKI